MQPRRQQSRDELKALRKLKAEIKSKRGTHHGPVPKADPGALPPVGGGEVRGTVSDDDDDDDGDGDALENGLPPTRSCTVPRPSWRCCG